MTIRGTCQNCAHSRLTDQMGAVGLYCHGGPPSLQLMPGERQGEIKMLGLWPPVMPAASCGAFEPDATAEQKVLA